MIGTLGTPALRGRALVAAYFILGALCAVMYVGAPHVPLAGSKLGLLLALALTAGPVALAFMIARPLVLPFALWAALVPFDDLLLVQGFGKIAKPLGAVAAACAIVTILVRRHNVRPPNSIAAWGAYVVLSIASLTWAQSTAFGILALQPIIGMLLVGFVLSMLPVDKIDLVALCAGTVAGGVCASLYEFYSFATTGRVAVLGASNTLIDHNHFGAALLLPLMCMTMAAISGRGPLRGWLCAILAAILIAGIGVSQSRGVLIAFGVGAAYMAWRSQYRWRLLAALGVGAALLAALPGVFARFNDPTAADASGRYEIWKIGFAAFKHHWFAGAGFGTFQEQYQAAFLEVSQSAESAQLVQMPHNIIVMTSVELGVIGLAVMAFAWWAQFRTLRMIPLDGSGWTDVRITMESMTVALVILTMSLDIMDFKYTWLAFSACWIAHAAYRTWSAGRVTVVPQPAEADALAHGEALASPA